MLELKKIKNLIECKIWTLKFILLNDFTKQTRSLTSPGVVPVRVIRRELLEPRSLHNVNPLRELHLTEDRILIRNYTYQHRNIVIIDTGKPMQ